MKLYTRTGDDGSTGLFGGKRVPKDDPRVAGYGEVDELNASLGLALTVCTEPDTTQALTRIQSELFVIGAELATPGESKNLVLIGDSQIAQLERWIDEAEGEITPLRNFVLPGGSLASAHLHAARTICRRAERGIVSLARREPLRPAIVVYLNRLGDLLFALARRANQRAGVADVPWIPPRENPALT